MASHDEWEFPWADVLDDPAGHSDAAYEAEAAYFRDVDDPSDAFTDDFVFPPSSGLGAAGSGRARSSARPESGDRDHEPDESWMPASSAPHPWPLDLGPPLLPLFVVVLVLTALAL